MADGLKVHNVNAYDRYCDFRRFMIAISTQISIFRKLQLTADPGL